MPVDLIGYIYAATVAAGGIIGYVKAGKFTIIKKKSHFRQMSLLWIFS